MKHSIKNGNGVIFGSFIFSHNQTTDYVSWSWKTIKINNMSMISNWIDYKNVETFMIATVCALLCYSAASLYDKPTRLPMYKI